MHGQSLVDATRATNRDRTLVDRSHAENRFRQHAEWPAFQVAHDVRRRHRCDDRAMPALIDSHSHIDDGSFDADRKQVLERARHAGVHAQIIPATTAASWAPIKALCEREAGLWPAYGLHPTFLDAHQPAHLNALREWIERERPIAVGEAGLDFWIEDLDRETQQTYFEAQLEIARDFELPVILHARKAYDAVTAALRRIGGLRGVVHSFSGSAEQAQQLWKLGFHIGIGGPVTYPRAQRLRGIVASMPIEHLLLETDSPDQPLCGRQGRRNEPALLVDVLATVAELRGESTDSVADHTRRNTERLFGIVIDTTGRDAGPGEDSEGHAPAVV